VTVLLSAAYLRKRDKEEEELLLCNREMGKPGRRERPPGQRKKGRKRRERHSST